MILSNDTKFWIEADSDGVQKKSVAGLYYGNRDHCDICVIMKSNFKPYELAYA